MRRLAFGSILIAQLISGFMLVATALQARPAPATIGGTMDIAASGLAAPPVTGYADGREIRFIHTEASDTKVAQILTTMMGSPVIVVPALALASEAILANVYAFRNGISGDGPFGFQLDVFDNPPGTEGYSPLRALILVTWKPEQPARVLRSAAEVQASAADGVLIVERSGVVINMPVVSRR